MATCQWFGTSDFQASCWWLHQSLACPVCCGEPSHCPAAGIARSLTAGAPLCSAMCAVVPGDGLIAILSPRPMPTPKPCVAWLGLHLFYSFFKEIGFSLAPNQSRVFHTSPPSSFTAAYHCWDCRGPSVLCGPCHRMCLSFFPSLLQFALAPAVEVDWASILAAKACAHCKASNHHRQEAQPDSCSAQLSILAGLASAPAPWRWFACCASQCTQRLSRPPLRLMSCSIRAGVGPHPSAAGFCVLRMLLSGSHSIRL